MQSDEVAEALAAIAAFDPSAPPPDMTAGMWALAVKLCDAADAVPTRPFGLSLTQRLTPAMQAGITRELWTMDRLYDEVMG